MYSFYCEKCGASFSSKDKEEVKRKRESHRPLFYGRRECILVWTEYGTLARPDLANYLNERHR